MLGKSNCDVQNLLWAHGDVPLAGLPETLQAVANFISKT